MSLLSRNTRGGRRGAAVAAVSALTLFTWLVVTALPASAVVSSCAYDGVTDTLNVVVGTDDRAVLDPNIAGIGGSGNYELLVDGNAAPIDCGVAPGGFAGATGWVNITGANDGLERLELYFPSAMSDENVTVDLGNGTDSLTLQYAETTWEDFFGVITNLVDISGGDTVNLATASAGGDGIGDMDDDLIADLRIDNSENITVSTGFGDDTVNAGLTGPFGGGDFVIDPREADVAPTTADIPEGDQLFGQVINFLGDTDDDIFVSGAANDVFSGQADVDTIDAGGATGDTTVDLTLGTATGPGIGTDTFTDVQSGWGTHDGNDTLIGNTLDNELHGRSGDDNLSGLAGDDDLFAGQGDDLLNGGADDDDEFGDADDDTFDQEAAANGADTINDFGGVNTLNYGARTTATVVVTDGSLDSGNDANADGDADDTGDEGDVIAGCDTVQVIITGSAADTITGCAADETFQPGAGDDNVDGNGGVDALDLSVVPGPAVFDLINGTATGNGTDTIEDLEVFIGTGGNDTVLFDDAGFPAAFDFFGGGGVDTIDGTATLLGFAVDLSTLGTGHDVENALGGAGDDVLTGNDVANRLIGNDGFDVIAGGDGNDYIEGGLGNDTLSGGLGGDTLVYVHSTGGMLVDNQLGFTDGDDGQDSIAFFEIILGSDFNDEIIGGQTAFDANNRYKGRGGNDELTGTNSSDSLLGGAGNDFVRAGNGDDNVKGGAGNDELLGSGGDDVLKGGKGNDTADGGPGHDTCKGVEKEKSC